MLSRRFHPKNDPVAMAIHLETLLGYKFPQDKENCLEIQPLPFERQRTLFVNWRSQQEWKQVKQLTWSVLCRGGFTPKMTLWLWQLIWRHFSVTNSHRTKRIAWKFSHCLLKGKERCLSTEDHNRNEASEAINSICTSFRRFHPKNDSVAMDLAS